MRLWAILVCMAVAWLTLRPAHAETHIQVLGAWPAGEAVTLHGRQSFWLHLGYSSDKPVHIWTEPYFEGKPVAAGSNPSPTYPAGSGEALGWFFLNDPAVQVDEVRISAGNGSLNGTPVVTTYRVHVDDDEQPASPTTPPEWVTRMSAQQQATEHTDYEKQMNAPMGAGDAALVYGFMLAMLAFGILGLGGPLWGLWRWRGSWRIAAAVPAAVMAFVMLHILIGTAIDPTSHNLWPFEILMWGVPSCVWMLVAGLAHKFSGAGRARSSG